MIGVPDYTKPGRELDVSGSWSPGDNSTHHIYADGEKVRFVVEGPDKRPEVNILDESLTERQFWKVVHYAREYGVPGVWKEWLFTRSEQYRLGGLYMVAGFDLTERESNYGEYGETPLVQ